MEVQYSARDKSLQNGMALAQIPIGNKLGEVVMRVLREFATKTVI